MSAKKNNNPIPFELAIETCSKGSHQKVIWKCPQCKTEGIRLFKSAIKTLACKACTLPETRKALNMRGAANPWFGKVPPCVTKGPDHPSWNPNLTPEERAKRINHRHIDDAKAVAWRKAVFARDNHTCQKCYTKQSPFNVHHLNSWAKYPEQRYDLTNGITLCDSCHKDFHKQYGRITSKPQFEDYVR